MHTRAVMKRQIILLLLVLSFFAGCERSPLTVEENQSPKAASLSKSITVNTPTYIFLTSLSTDPDGDEIRYATIQQFPKNGHLSLSAGWSTSPSSKDIPYDKAFKNEKVSSTKFNPRELRVRYVPKKDFIGTDFFTYQVVDSRGEKSNGARVAIEVSPKAIPQKNHPPVAYPLTLHATPNKSVYLDLTSITFDPDGDYLTLQHVFFNTTFEKRELGLKAGSSFLNYLPNKIGEEVLPYVVVDESGSRAEGKITIQVLASPEVSYSDRHQLGGFKSYLDALPDFTRYRVIYFHSWIQLFFAFFSAFMAMLVSKALQSIPIKKYVLNVFGLVITLLGILLLLRIGLMTGYSLKHVALSTFLTVSGLVLIGAKQTQALGQHFFKFVKNPVGGLLLILFIANNLILVFDYTSISLPAISLDSYGYIQFYEFFRHGIWGYVREDHSRRIFTPFLASLLPTEDPVAAFKIVNIIFINLTVVALYQLWRKLKINPYYILIAFLWLFLHQYGVIRFYNFYPTSIDVPAFLFLTLLVYAIFTNRYAWLLWLSPLASTHQIALLVFVFTLLFYKVGSYVIFPARQSVENKKTIGIIFASILLSLFCTYLISFFVFPYQSGTTLYLIYRGLLSVAGVRPLNMFIMILSYCYCYGGLLVLATQCALSAYPRRDFYNILLLFFAINFAFGWITMSTRVVFMGYPFIMTFILLSINALRPTIVTIAFVLSIPLMRLVGFPFFLESDPIFENFSKGEIALYGVFMVFLYAVLNYFRQLELTKKARQAQALQSKNWSDA